MRFVNFSFDAVCVFCHKQDIHISKSKHNAIDSVLRISKSNFDKQKLELSCHLLHKKSLFLARKKPVLLHTGIEKFHESANSLIIKATNLPRKFLSCGWKFSPGSRGAIKAKSVLIVSITAITLQAAVSRRAKKLKKMFSRLAEFIIAVVGVVSSAKHGISADEEKVIPT